MKVLLIDVNCKSGSTGKIVYDLYNEIRCQGGNAAICYGRGPVVKGENIYKIANKLEVYFHVIMTRVTGMTGIFSPFATYKLLKIIKDFKPDVVHIHEMHGYYVNFSPVIKYLKLHDIRTIWTFHCEFMYTGRCGYTYDCKKWLVGCGKCPYKHNYVATYGFDFSRFMFNKKKQLLENWDKLTIVTPSIWLRNKCMQSFLSKRDIRVINNGVNKNIFFPREFNYIKSELGILSEKIILTVAPNIMSERKGGAYFVRIAKDLKNYNYKFIMVGVKDEDFVKYDFPDNIILIKRTNNQEYLAGLYSMADIFVICSNMENFPTTCIEAISCGTPVCGFDVGGVKETYPICPDNFVKFGDLEALEGCIIKNLTKNDKNVVPVEMYDSRIMLENYWKLYGNA